MLRGHWKYKLNGVHAADIFPQSSKRNTFMIIISRGGLRGRTLASSLKQQRRVRFAAPLGLPIHSYNDFYHQLCYARYELNGVLKKTLQKFS